MKTISVVIKGISPLLMNRFREQTIEGKSKRRPGATSEPHLEDKLYLHKGRPYIPATYFRNCITEAAKQFKVSGKGKSTYSKIIGSTIEVTPEILPLEPDAYEEFRIAAVNPMTKGRMMVSRPRFNEWGASFHVILHDEGVPISVLNEILAHAGTYVGVGDWRPDKKGSFGKFLITKFEET